MFFNRGDDWLQDLPSEIQSLIRQKMSVIHLDDGDNLYQQGEEAAAIYQVLSGLIHLKRPTASGTESIVTLYQSGNCFGEIPLLLSLPDQRRGYNAVASGKSEIACLSQRDFEEIATQHPQVYQKLIAKLCRIIQRLLQHAEDISNANLNQRLASLLLDAVECHGVESHKIKGGEDETSQGICIDIPLSQTDMGKMLGVTRQSIQRELKHWREQNWIKKEGGRLKILELDQLKKLVAKT